MFKLFLVALFASPFVQANGGFLEGAWFKLSSGSNSDRSNPFSDTALYVPPYYTANVKTTADKFPQYKDAINRAGAEPVHFWVDSMSKIAPLDELLNQASKQQAARAGAKTTVSIVVYDLPDRDCAAAASNGEISCADNSCSAGLSLYKSSYIDAIVNVLVRYPSLTITAVIEPDSLPNLATNLGVPKCQQAQEAYKAGVTYAIKAIGGLPNLYLYVDVGHGGWLGWTNNAAAYASVLKSVVDAAGGQQLVRGLATNTANYQPLGTQDSTDDPCQLKTQYNFGYDEVHYMSVLSSALTSVGFSNFTFLSDTSRNGVVNMRQSCSNWCNIKGAGFGERPSADTRNMTTAVVIDAFAWIKVPGEADGTSDVSSPRYDYHCGSVDSVIPAPEAGQWFDSYFVSLVQNAHPPI